MDSPTGRLGRWALELQQYTFDVQYRRGSLNRVADALSRRPQVNAVRQMRCPWYTRQMRKVTERSEEHPEYEIRRGRLFRHILHSNDFKETPSKEQWKECVSRDQRLPILRRLNDDPTARHLGAKTLARRTAILLAGHVLRRDPICTLLPELPGA